MKKIFFVLIFATILIDAQTTYYYATGKDSITYVATSIGLMVLTRNANQELVFHSIVNDSNKVYTRAMDNDNLLLLSTNSQVDLYSLSNKYSPSYIGTLYIDKIISIRPFGNHFAILRGGFSGGIYDHLVVGFGNDSLNILETINSYSHSYTGKTAFTPEVVYPYFFCTANDNQILLMYKFNEINKTFNFLDTLRFLATNFSLGQMWGGRDRLYFREIKYFSGGYDVNEKKINISNNPPIILSIRSWQRGQHWFTDEIECTDSLIRFNGWYSYLNGTSLSEPNQYLFCCANLSGIRIYNTIISNNKFYYSTKIVGTVINSSQFVYTPSSIDDLSDVHGFSLSQNYPNPFNPSTKIKYSIPALGTQRAVSVQLKVYDVLGNEVATLVDEYKPVDSYEVDFPSAIGDSNSKGVPSGLASGIYFYQLKAGDFIETKKMILLR